jgi:orotidine-5'-phosphate decarboxylase
MSAVKELVNIQQTNKSMICLGLDLDPKKMPAEYGNSVKGMFEFAHRVIDATADVVCAYKPNMAFFEALGPEGFSLLRLIVQRIPEHVPIILDGKRGDIGNTAQFYADSMYNIFRASWVTINPYMGYDSMRPFLEYKGKGVFVLCLTSNPGSKDFQQLKVDGVPLYCIVAQRTHYWNKEQNCGLVVGATHPDQLQEIREVAGDMPLLVPGVGAQGGSLEESALLATDNFRKPAVINVSRSVLYASTEKDFAVRARSEIMRMNAEVERLRAGRPVEQPPAAATVSPPFETLPSETPPSPDSPSDQPPPPLQ